MTNHYSGNGSREFWNRVGLIDDVADHAALYALGVALQNLEEDVLRQLRNAEAKRKSRRRRHPHAK